MPSRTTHGRLASAVRIHGYSCWYCGVDFSPIDPPTVEHLRSRSRLGVERARNRVPACITCNHVKNSFSELLHKLADAGKRTHVTYQRRYLEAAA